MSSRKKGSVGMNSRPRSALRRKQTQEWYALCRQEEHIMRQKLWRNVCFRMVIRCSQILCDRC